jgi:RNA binding exosome subunit
MAEAAKFSSADISFLVHATEDKDRVSQAVSESLGVAAERFSFSESEGHFGNKILLAFATIEANSATTLVSRIVSSLTTSDKDTLARKLDQYTDEKGNLYIRLDKQKVMRRKISLSESDSIRVRFRPIRRYRPGSNVQTYRGLLSFTE